MSSRAIPRREKDARWIRWYSYNNYIGTGSSSITEEVEPLLKLSYVKTLISSHSSTSAKVHGMMLNLTRSTRYASPSLFTKLSHAQIKLNDIPRSFMRIGKPEQRVLKLREHRRGKATHEDWHTGSQDIFEIHRSDVPNTITISLSVPDNEAYIIQNLANGSISVQLHSLLHTSFYNLTSYSPTVRITSWTSWISSCFHVNLTFARFPQIHSVRSLSIHH